MASHHYSCSSTSSSNSSTGSAYRLILDHVMTYPGSYELPLRTMYNLNCTARARAPQHSASHHSSTATTPDVPQAGFVDAERVPTFTENLLAQISSANNQPLSLSPTFIVSFVQRCFPPQLLYVDFPKALTGLDYLKDLEMRRRREVHAAMDRLRIDRDMLHQDDGALASAFPGVAQWLKTIEEREHVVDTLYTQLYIGLRRWILINELSLTPFSKHNCLAMLNTLYPPALATQPTSRLTRPVLKQQRDGYFRYITHVEKVGTGVLRNLIIQGKAPDDDNGWPAIVRTVEHYLQVAVSMINECLEITGMEDVAPDNSLVTVKESKDSRRKGKADSGISFGGSSERRPSTRGSMHAPESPDEQLRPKTPNLVRSGTALEKIARGLMSIGRARTEATEMIYDDDEPPVSSMERPIRMLRKMRSFGSMESRSRQASETPQWDADAMSRHRKKYDAGIAAAQQGNGGKRQSAEA